jgi:hypothetical protein
VPSLDDALREMELAPLHEAVRGERPADALREAAALLGTAGRAANGRGPLPAQLEKLVAASRPEMARGKWIYDWRLDRVWPDADLVALELDPPANLLADDRFRRAIGVNRHDGTEWFNKERFESAIERLALPAAQRKRLGSAARKSGYRVDALVEALGKAPAKRAAGGAAKAPVRARSPKPLAKPKPRAKAGGK